MLKLPDKEQSLLLKNPAKKYPKLKENIETDTVVVGGGIVGLSTAYLLAEAGQKVSLVEKDLLGNGTSGKTTGKVTSQHNLFYTELARHRGQKAAKLYGQANQSAVDGIEQIIKSNKISCGWERQDNYVFTTKPDQLSQFNKEAQVASKLGLPATFQKTIPLPINTIGVVRFKNQAHFNAYAYLQGLAEAAAKMGAKIYENTRVSGFNDGSPASVSTSDATVTAKNIVVATNVPPFPLLARGAYCLLEYPTTSYLVAGKYDGDYGGMYISPDKDHYSVLPIKAGDTKLLLIGGRNHIRGPRNARKRWQQLADYGEQKLNLKSVDYMWSAWDYIAYDDVPLIGKLYPWSKHLYVATAFKKWGLAHSWVAASILRDQILGRQNPWAEIYKPIRRSPIKAIPRVAAQHLGF